MNAPAVPPMAWNQADSQVRHGTLACLARWLDRPGVVSASHVLAPLRRGLDVSALPQVRVGDATQAVSGTLSNWDVPMTPDGAPLFSHDAAFATVDATGFAWLSQRMALPSALRSPDQAGETVYFWGSTSGVVKRTTIQALDASVTMRCRFFLSAASNANFVSVNVPMSGLIQCDAQPPVEPGDSGCLLFDGDGRALGILIGTDPANVYPYFSPLAPILDQFGLSLVTAKDVAGATSLVDVIPRS